MVTERYMFACRDEALERSVVVELLTLLRGPQLREIIGPIPNYGLDQPDMAETVQAIRQRFADDAAAAQASSWTTSGGNAKSHAAVPRRVPRGARCAGRRTT